MRYLFLSLCIFFCFNLKAEEGKIIDNQNPPKQTLSEKENFGYYGKWAVCRSLTLDEIKEKLDQNQPYVLRLKCPATLSKKIFLRQYSTRYVCQTI